MPHAGDQVSVKRRVFSHLASLLIVIVVTHISSPAAAQQEMSRSSREAAQSMLQSVAADIKKHYYDPKFHGLDWDAVVAETRGKIDKSPTFDMAVVHIAAAVDALNDSHTTFSPPRAVVNIPNAAVSDWRARMMLANSRHDYGWRHEMVGDRCFVTHVRPGSDAEKKGLHVGDEILSMNGYHPERASIQRAEYVFNVLRPQDELKLDVKDPSGARNQVTVLAKVQQVSMMSQYERSGRTIRAYEDRQRLSKPRLAEFGDDLAIIKLPEFYLLDAAQSWIDKARKHKALILDLRDNHGGAEVTLQYLLGGIFDHEVKICDKVMRSDQKALNAKPLGHTFDGKIIVLVDSRSKSAAELFSRVVQIEKRGLVMGDRSAGSVMSARYYPYQLFGAAVYYGVLITEADLVMADGKSLEHVGVTPDELMVPTASDLAKGLDPVLSHAADTLGVKLSPEQAGRLFPYEWPPE